MQGFLLCGNYVCFEWGGAGVDDVIVGGFGDDEHLAAFGSFAKVGARVGCAYVYGTFAGFDFY